MEKKYLIFSIVINILFWALTVFVPLWGFLEERFNIDFILLGAPFLVWFQFVIFILFPVILGLIYLFPSQNKKYLVLGLLLHLVTIVVFILLLFVEGRHT